MTKKRRGYRGRSTEQFWKDQPQYLKLKFFGKERTFRKRAFDGICQYVWKKGDSRVYLRWHYIDSWTGDYRGMRVWPAQRTPQQALNHLARFLRLFEKELRTLKE